MIQFGKVQQNVYILDWDPTGEGVPVCLILGSFMSRNSQLQGIKLVHACAGRKAHCPGQPAHVHSSLQAQPRALFTLPSRLIGPMFCLPPSAVVTAFQAMAIALSTFGGKLML